MPKVKVTFKIIEVNYTRKQRTDDFIKVDVFEDDEHVGWFWQSPKLIKGNIKRFGKDSYLNHNDFEKLFKGLEQ